MAVAAVTFVFCAWAGVLENNTSPRPKIDFGGLVNIIRIGPAGNLTFQDLELLGAKSQSGLDLMQNRFPRLGGLIQWPTIVAEVTSYVRPFLSAVLVMCAL